MERGLEGCWACGELDGCRKGLLAKSKPRGFSLFVRRYGMQALLDRLERNEQAGVVYHRTGVVGDYDGFDSEEALIAFFVGAGKGTGLLKPVSGADSGALPAPYFFAKTLGCKEKSLYKRGKI